MRRDHHGRIRLEWAGEKGPFLSAAQGRRARRSGNLGPSSEVHRPGKEAWCERWVVRVGVLRPSLLSCRHPMQLRPELYRRV